MVERLETARWLDRAGDPVQHAVQAVAGGRVRDVLHGVWLGHPLHPMAVMLPLGAWIGAAVIDTAGAAQDRAGARRDARGYERAATVLVGVGAAGALPAATAGLNDWATLSREQRRVGLVHAGANTVALGLYVGSFVARLAGRRRLGRRLGLAALSLAGLGGYLGGHMTYRQAAGVNQAAPLLRRIPDGWHDVCDLDALVPGRPTVAKLGEVPILVTRAGDGGEVSAMIERCGHQTGPLGEGKVTEMDGADCVVCPWHGSVFRLSDGSVMAGPAATNQPVLRTRITAGRVQAALP
ncbi:MAG TPA: Rieske (2Fe-2S) protein [Micromonosporaceae bacterium]|nr:Rieske (2Fe-2S) protein [Micromonosporaceae bacterium]